MVHERWRARNASVNLSHNRHRLAQMLTSREHLTLFARIKGIPEANVRAAAAMHFDYRSLQLATYVDLMINRIGLANYADKPCGSGLRRRLARKLLAGWRLGGQDLQRWKQAQAQCRHRPHCVALAHHVCRRQSTARVGRPRDRGRG